MKGEKISADAISFKERLKALSNIPRLLKMVWETNPYLTIATVVTRIILAALPVAILYVGKLFINEVVMLIHSSDKTLSHAYLWKLVAIEFGLVITTNALNRVILLIDVLLGDRLSNYSFMRIMSHASKLDLEQFEDSVFYDKLERARQQCIGRTVLLTNVFGQLQDTVTVCFLISGLVFFSPWFTIILFVSTLPSFLGEYYFNNKNYTLIRGQMERRREMEYISSLGTSDITAKEVRAFDLSSFFVNRFRNISNRLYFDIRALETRRSTWAIVLAITGSIGYYSAFVYIIQKVLAGSISIGDLTFLLGSIRQVSGVLQNLMKRFSTVSQGAIYLSDFFEFFEIMPKIKMSPNPRPFPRPIKEGFTFENVGFKYNNSTRWANRNLNFTLHAGEKLALVGENGAGKTTLVKLLVRLYDPTEGRILLDGVDLREYDLSELRLEIGIIFQDFLKYQMTTTENIAVGNISEMDNHSLIAKSAKKSLANIFIEKLPKQYDQMLGRHFHQGVELSGGEWQKIALARAYMRDAQLMVLDEPTAALDARSEFEVFQRFSELTKNKSALLISHRFSTVRMANRILVLEKGELLEVGSHDELLQQNGKYAELFELQAMGYR
ncbi:ABC transporter ATP-binding protein [Segetibacter sp.]|jgi:ATP-binding cassette subfamily B protein|uniref:ABC transporter ATP-binding protein n=1 Tax=Segetibacter sp. TaxID=2231182 RepID=UPI0026100A40|nr:ABC transporter ATP-binding protein [Segetibacter sp.]MCW3082602.1 transporter ATP-binding protein [Segetibacter sp.]